VISDIRCIGIRLGSGGGDEGADEVEGCLRLGVIRSVIRELYGVGKVGKGGEVIEVVFWDLGVVTKDLDELCGSF